MHILPFGIGAVLFYGLLAKSRAVPVWLSLWGLITVIPVFVGTILGIYGIEIPFVVNLPYVPFEFFIGIFILIKGVRINNNAICSPSGQFVDASLEQTALFAPRAFH
jgi:hypothetical protein